MSLTKRMISIALVASLTSTACYTQQSSESQVDSLRNGAALTVAALVISGVGGSWLWAGASHTSEMAKITDQYEAQRKTPMDLEYVEPHITAVGRNAAVEQARTVKLMRATGKIEDSEVTLTVKDPYGDHEKPTPNIPATPVTNGADFSVSYRDSDGKISRILAVQTAHHPEEGSVSYNLFKQNSPYDEVEKAKDYFRPEYLVPSGRLLLQRNTNNPNVSVEAVVHYENIEFKAAPTPELENIFTKMTEISQKLEKGEQLDEESLELLRTQIALRVLETDRVAELIQNEESEAFWALARAATIAFLGSAGSLLFGAVAADLLKK